MLGVSKSSYRLKCYIEFGSQEISNPAPISYLVIYSTDRNVFSEPYFLASKK